MFDEYNIYLVEIKFLIGKFLRIKDNYKVEIVVNIGGIKDVNLVLENDVEVIGLFRIEFFYMDNDYWFIEEE